MIIIPAIDIKNNNCVRLKKGKFNKIFVFSKNPLIIFNKFKNLNIKRLHIVDLDGALKGKPKNLLIMKDIIKYNKNIALQIGGGIRNLETIDYYFNMGFSYVILGTKAVMDLEFLQNVCLKFKNKIILGLDLKNSKIVIDGWKNYYNLNFLNYLKEINNFDLESLIYTDVNRDGTFKGINLKMLNKISKYFKKPIIMSGGLCSINDIKNLYFFQKKNILGIIGGSSIYHGKIDLKSLNKKLNYYNKFYLNKI